MKNIAEIKEITRVAAEQNELEYSKTINEMVVGFGDSKIAILMNQRIEEAASRGLYRAQIRREEWLRLFGDKDSHYVIAIEYYKSLGYKAYFDYMLHGLLVIWKEKL